MCTEKGLSVGRYSGTQLTLRTLFPQRHVCWPHSVSVCVGEDERAYVRVGSQGASRPELSPQPLEICLLMCPMVDGLRLCGNSQVCIRNSLTERQSWELGLSEWEICLIKDPRTLRRLGQRQLHRGFHEGCGARPSQSSCVHKKAMWSFSQDPKEPGAGTRLCPGLSLPEEVSLSLHAMGTASPSVIWVLASNCLIQEQLNIHSFEPLNCQYWARHRCFLLLFSPNPSVGWKWCVQSSVGVRGSAERGLLAVIESCPSSAHVTLAFLPQKKGRLGCACVQDGF